MLVRNLLQRDVVTVSPDAAVLEAARLMRTEHVGDVVVTGPGRRPIGMLTDRDIVVSVLAEDVDHLSKLTVKDVLSGDLVAATENEDATVVLERMRERGVRRMPVIDREGVLVGVLSVDDILERVADDLRRVVSLIAKQRRIEQWRRP